MPLVISRTFGRTAKGYSRCLYGHTALNAIEVVARGINARVFLRKTSRCSGKFEKIADHLSCSECEPAFNLMGRNNTFMMPPRTLGKFLISPVPNRVLGQAILSERGSSMEVMTPEVEFRQELSSCYHWSWIIVRSMGVWGDVGLVIWSFSATGFDIHHTWDLVQPAREQIDEW